LQSAPTVFCFIKKWYTIEHMKHEHHHKREDFIHHNKSIDGSLVREIVFGMEDGLVSTLGAITGIAAAAQSHYLVVLAGFVVISVESISMAVGSYLSNKSEKEIDERKVFEEKTELKEYPEEEKKELIAMYVQEGWPSPLATQMTEVAAKNPKLFLKEMVLRELKIIPGEQGSPLRNGIAMGISYIIGGSIALLPYIFISTVHLAIIVSVPITLCALFLLGVGTARFSKRKWWKSGLEMLILAALAASIGYGVGQGVDLLVQK